jgi:hypothetical protein
VRASFRHPRGKYAGSLRLATRFAQEEFAVLPDILKERLVRLVKQMWDRTRHGNELTSLLLKRPEECIERSQERRSSNLARTNRCITANTIAAETPNMSAPLVASSGPSKRHDGVRSTSP